MKPIVKILVGWFIFLCLFAVFTIKVYSNPPFDIFYGSASTGGSSPALTYINSHSSSAATGTAIQDTHGFTIASGDLLICIVHGNGAPTFVDNNGADPFTELVDGTANSSNRAIYWRIADATEGATFDFTMSASNRWSIVAIQLRPGSGSVQNPPIDVTPAANVADTGSSTTPSATQITVGVDHATLLWVVTVDGASTAMSAWPAAADDTTISEINDQALYVGIGVNVSAGATGAVAGTLNPTDVWSAQLFSLKPGS